MKTFVLCALFAANMAVKIQEEEDIADFSTAWGEQPQENVAPSEPLEEIVDAWGKSWEETIEKHAE